MSGKPTADQLYKISRTLIDLMLEVPHPDGKTLIFSSAAVDIFVMMKLKIGPFVVRQTSDFPVTSGVTVLLKNINSWNSWFLVAHNSFGNNFYSGPMSNYK